MQKIITFVSVTLSFEFSLENAIQLFLIKVLFLRARSMNKIIKINMFHYIIFYLI